MNRYRLQIDTKDEKGLIYLISKVLFEHNINIEKNDEFVDEEAGKFFMRSELVGEIDEEKLINALAEALHDDATIKLTKERNKDIVIMATKESHCLGDILIRYQSGELDANIKGVVSNYDTLKPLVEKFDIPFFYVSHEGLSREEHESEIIKCIATLEPELIVLAKYMRILTPSFVEHYPEQLLNIHHSFLPAFIGANPYKQAYERGVKIIGATAHVVTNDLDEGPIISQDVVHVDHSYSWQEMRKSGRNVEKVVLSKAIDLLLEDRVFVYDNKTVIF